ncbi:hypothetical protein O152_gp058 [Pseudomonas phage PaBG]|uniref:Uncharacterized protein n=1 Tax=Pseudomonas phage PaBG TaxID=1335230 RepID=S5VV33_9CAUD|nr:hypothetical protein O152_gp058 [Pseudomonas phage PaBG]AGS81942.1 hypothetical protein PaBG_00058 [Pseudomonas phage PaBG]
MKALYVLAHFLEYAKKKDWRGAPKWKLWMADAIAWSFLLFLLMVFVVIPLIADLNTLSESKACAEKYGVKCEQRWVPVSD